MIMKKNCSERNYKLDCIWRNSNSDCDICRVFNAFPLISRVWRETSTCCSGVECVKIYQRSNDVRWHNVYCRQPVVYSQHLSGFSGNCRGPHIGRLVNVGILISSRLDWVYSNHCLARPKCHRCADAKSNIENRHGTTSYITWNAFLTQILILLLLLVSLASIAIQFWTNTKHPCWNGA